jgi:hypothetical protein
LPLQKRRTSDIAGIAALVASDRTRLAGGARGIGEHLRPDDFAFAHADCIAVPGSFLGMEKKCARRPE